MIAAADATWLASLRSEICDQWRISRDRSLSELLAKVYRLSPITESDPGDYDLQSNPYWRDVIDACSDRRVRRVSVLKSTQVGGTITVQGILMALAVIDPAPGMIVFPTQSEATTQRDRVFGNALESRREFRELVPPERLWNTRSMELGGAEYYLAWSGSPQRLRGKPCKRIAKHETDVYEYDGDAGNPHKAADERTKQFWEHLILEESTPVGDDSYIYGQWMKSQQRRWYCPCPHCGTFQELRFFPPKAGRHAGCGGVVGIKDDSGNLLEPELAEVRAYYVCVNGCRIDQHYKNLMIAGGKWVADGQRIDDEGNVYGSPRKDGRHVGFHIWTIMQSKISIGKLARAYIEHVNDNDLRSFFQNWLGLRFQSVKSMPSHRYVGSKFAGGYSKGQVPSDVWFLTAGSDVQLDQLYWVVVGWAPQRTPFLVDWGEIFRDRAEIYEESGVVVESEDEETGDDVILASDLVKLPSVVLGRTWPMQSGVNPFGRPEVAVRLLNCDTNFRPDEVHDLARSINTNRFRCVRGDDAVKPKERYRMSVVDRNSRTGKIYEGGLELWSIYKMFYQDAITQRLNAAVDQPGVFHFPTDIATKGRKFLRQLCNVRKDKRGYYETITRTIGKDFRDCLGYAEAAADMVVGSIGWELPAWEAWRRNYLEQQRKREETVKRSRESARQQRRIDILER